MKLEVGDTIYELTEKGEVHITKKGALTTSVIDEQSVAKIARAAEAEVKHDLEKIH